VNEFTLILGGALTVFVFINFFVQSWAIVVSCVIFGAGCIYSMVNSGVVNPFLMGGVAVLTVGQLLGAILLSYKHP
jgi:hypothetical protein